MPVGPAVLEIAPKSGAGCLPNCSTILPTLPAVAWSGRNPEFRPEIKIPAGARDSGQKKFRPEKKIPPGEENSGRKADIRPENMDSDRNSYSGRKNTKITAGIEISGPEFSAGNLI